MNESNLKNQISRVVEGDQAAFEEISKCYYAYIRGVIRKVGVTDYEMQKDLAQETLIIVWKNLATTFEYRGIKASLGWVGTIAKNIALRHLKKPAVKREQTVHDADGTSVLLNITSKEPQPDESLGINDRKKQLEEAIESLPEAQKKVIIFVYLEELNLREIGEILGLTSQAVGARLRSAIAKLRAHLYPDADLL